MAARSDASAPASASASFVPVPALPRAHLLRELPPQQALLAVHAAPALLLHELARGVQLGAQRREHGRRRRVERARGAQDVGQDPDQLVGSGQAVVQLLHLLRSVVTLACWSATTHRATTATGDRTRI